jgi:broad specificity phosphatase PhoE
MKKTVVLLLSIALFSCSNSRYLYIVRHGERLDNTPYSVLSPAGHERAKVLRDSLLNKKIDVIFATFFQRTQETARPLADALHKPIALCRNNAVDSIITVLNNIKNKNILMVSHSGNIPSIIEGLTGEKIEANLETSYDNLFIIKTKNGKRQLIQRKYGDSSH